MEDRTPSFTERWLDTVCRFSYALYIVLIIEVLLSALAIAAWLFGSLTEATRAILLVDLVLLGLAMAVTAGLLSACNR